MNTKFKFMLVLRIHVENTRAAYPIEFIPNAKIPCVGPHPKNVILLACDAFGVLPPVSKLTLAQTMYHFISGYTALVSFKSSDTAVSSSVAHLACFPTYDRAQFCCRSPGQKTASRSPKRPSLRVLELHSSCFIPQNMPQCWPIRCRSMVRPPG